MIEFLEWLVSMGLPFISTLAGLTGISAIIYYNKVVQLNQTFGLWSWGGFLLCGLLIGIGMLVLWWEN